MYLVFLRVFACLCCFIVSLPAYAASIDEAGAARLKAVFETVIADQMQYVPKVGPRPEFEGGVVVEPAATYYAVTLPYYRVHLEDGMRMDVGMVSINATPDGDREGRWKMALAAPTPIVIVDSDEKPLFRVDIGAQRAAGIWDEAIGNFVKLDALYSDITAQSTTNEDFRVMIPQALVRYDFAEGADQTLSGDGFLLIKNMAGDFVDAGVKGSIESVRMDFKLDRYDAQALLKHQKRLQALAASADTEGLDVAAHGKALSETLLKMYTSFGEQFKATYSVKGVDFRSTKETKKGNLGVDDLTVGFDVGGFVSDEVYLGLVFGFLGLDGEADQLDTALAPTDMNFDLKVKNIPVKQVSGIAQNAVQASAHNPKGGAMAMMSLAMKLPVVLSQAGTVLEMKDTYIGNDSYRFELGGVVKADMEAVNSATADLRGRFKGLDGVLRQVRAQAVNDPSSGARYDELIQKLQMLQAVGAKQGEQDLYLYDFQMNPQGQMLLNGQDAKAVLGGR